MLEKVSIVTPFVGETVFFIYYFISNPIFYEEKINTNYLLY